MNEELMAQRIAGRVLALVAERLTEASVLMTAPAPAVQERPSHEELLAALRLEQERRGVLPSSIEARERRVRGFMTNTAPGHVLDATKEDVERYLDRLDLQIGSRAAYLSHIHAFYKWAARQGLITSAPTEDITRPRERRHLPKPIADADLARAVAASSGQLRCWLLLGAYEGLRAQEIAGLAGEDVDRENGVLLVRHGKGDKHRAVPLHPEVAAVLPDRPGPLFSLADGRPVRSHNVSHFLGDHFARLGITASAHGLRHWFATKLYQSTQDLRLTQELLGHSSPATTQRYAAFDATRAAPAVAGLSVR